MRNRLTYANVISTIALFVALGGTATAASLLIRSNKQLRTGVVNSRVIKNNAITARDVKNRSLVKRDFKTGQLPAGAQGPPGLVGAQGSPGASAATASLEKGQSLRGQARFREGQGGEPSDTTADALNVQFQIPLHPDAAVQTRLRPVGAAPDHECTGTADAPEAAPGFLCVYKKSESAAVNGSLTQAKHPLTGSTASPSRFGFAIDVVSGGGNAEAAYSWAVTAP